MDSNVLEPWPKHSAQHELRSLRLFLARYTTAPEEIRIREIEGAFERPMIQISLLQSRLENFSQFHFTVHRVLALTFFGGDEQSEEDRYQEAWRVHDWLSEVFMRGFGHHGPVIQVFDFSEDPASLTSDWIEVESATVEQRPDKFGLWTVPVDLRYHVTRDEAEFTEDALITVEDIILRHEDVLIEKEIDITP